MPQNTVVYLCDRDLKPVTDPIEWTAIDATVRHLEPGSAEVTVVARPDVMAELDEDGRRAVLIHDGQIFIGGPIEQPQGEYTWSAGDSDDGVEPGTVKFHFTNDLALAAARSTYPDPSAEFEAQTTDATYTATGTASTVLSDLINLNAGPGALSTPMDRRVPAMVMGTDPVAGPSISISTRFQPLLDEARSIVAKAGGAIGYRTVIDQAAREVTFEIFATVDRSASVRFSRGLGNLRSVRLRRENPRATTALVAGQGEGIARAFVERTDSVAEAAGWRLEEFVDARHQDTTALLEAAGDERLAERAARVQLGTVTVDTPDQRYGVHYGLGDLVTIEPVAGLVLVETVRSAHLQVTPEAGAVLTAVVGSQALTSDPQWLRMALDLARRLGRLEAI